MMIIDLIMIMLMMIVEQKKDNLYIYGNDDVYHDVEWKTLWGRTWFQLSERTERQELAFLY